MDSLQLVLNVAQDPSLFKDTEQGGSMGTWLVSETSSYFNTSHLYDSPPFILDSQRTF